MWASTWVEINCIHILYICALFVISISEIHSFLLGLGNHQVGDEGLRGILYSMLAVHVGLLTHVVLSTNNL